MKEVRGAEAVRYAGEMGIDFDIDRGYLADRESLIRGHRASPVDVYMLLDGKLGREFDPAEVLPGSDVFELLTDRYGDGWAYVALEGDSPEVEEKITLRLFRRLLEGEEPVAPSDVRELFIRFGFPRLGVTGFPRSAHLNLVFHAALRLAGKGALESVEDTGPPREGQPASYGGRRFIVPADVEISLAGVLCERCRARTGSPILRLHRECAARLRTTLRKVRGSAGGKRY